MSERSRTRSRARRSDSGRVLDLRDLEDGPPVIVTTRRVALRRRRNLDAIHRVWLACHAQTSLAGPPPATA